MILGHFLKVKQIYYTGFDGAIKILTGDHAFQQGKTKLPNYTKREHAVELFDKHNRFFFEYFFNYLESDTTIYNLAEDIDYNMPAKYSRKFCPLPDSIKILI
jgi:hypothetical protein